MFLKLGYVFLEFFVLKANGLKLGVEDVILVAKLLVLSGKTVDLNDGLL